MVDFKDLVGGAKNKMSLGKIGRGVDDRSFYLPKQQTTVIAPFYSTSPQVVHELGHALESSNPAVGNAVRDFYKKRTLGLRAEKMADILPNDGYAAKELTKRDGFWKPYTGKVYSDGSTEVLSMGLQHMYQTPIEFAAADPEHFEFIMTILRNLRKGTY